MTRDMSGSLKDRFLESGAILKFFARRVLPERWWMGLRNLRSLCGLVSWGWYDLSRFHSALLPKTAGDRRERNKADCLRLIHSLEKGGSLPLGRVPFGRGKLPLLEATRIELQAPPQADFYVRYADQTMDRTRGINASSQPPTGPDSPKPTQPAGLAPDQAQFSAFTFFSDRHSCRHFQSATVPKSLLEEITRWAQSAPSVCNRQGARVRYILDADLRQRVLELQNGNRGFGHQIPVVAILSCDLRIFIDNTERNQGWIDGGLFAMTLVLAAHARGLGTCFLNWCRSPAQDRSLREILSIPSHEHVLTLLGIGFPHPQATPTESRRRPLQEVLLSFS